MKIDNSRVASKTCWKCSTEKPLSAFHKDKSKEDGHTTVCATCRNSKMREYHKAYKLTSNLKQTRKNYYQLNKPAYRARAQQWRKANPDKVKSHSLKQDHGITKAEYDKEVALRDGRCDICKKTPVHVLNVDHCHKTNKRRGLLCRYCNQGLGFFQDNPFLLTAAREYLLAH